MSINPDLPLVVMDNIYKYLNQKDLCTLAKVSKSWRDAVSCERGRKLRVQLLRVPYKIHLLKTGVPDMPRLLEVYPQASVFIYDKRMEILSMRNDPPVHLFDGKVLRDFKRKLPNKAIVFMVDECFTTEDEDFEGIKNLSKIKLTGNYDLLGLFFPSLKPGARVDAAWARTCTGYSEEVVDFLADDLDLDFDDNERPKSTILFFIDATCDLSVVDAFSRKSVRDGKETIWAVGIKGNLLAADCPCLCYWSRQSTYSNKYGQLRKKRKTNRKTIKRTGEEYLEEVRDNQESLCALKISGSTVESWTAYIDTRLPFDEIDRQLYELKEKVSSRRNCSGLVCAPVISENSSAEIMKKLKLIFSDISFVGLFNKNNWVLLSDEYAGNIPGGGIWLNTSTYMSIIIISLVD